MNAVNWFEIPTKDLKRAKAFYAGVFEVTFEDMEMDNMLISVFSGKPENPGAMGALLGTLPGKEPYVCAPNDQGTVVYFACEDLNNELGRVESHGGKVLVEKTAIGENGFIAHFLDSEGNRVALHSMQ